MEDRSTIIKETNVRKANVAETFIESVKGRPVLHHMVAVLLGEAKEVNLISPTRGRVGRGLEVAPAASEENIGDGAERMPVANLVLRDLGVRVAIGNVSRVAWIC